MAREPDMPHLTMGPPPVCDGCERVICDCEWLDEITATATRIYWDQ